MTMIAYMDESGTHGDASGTMVLGGFLATAQSWDAYNADLNSLLKLHEVEYFHANKFRKCRGPFKHFTRAKQVIFIHDFFDLINNHLAYGFAVSLTPQDFLEVYKHNPKLPKRFRGDSQYGFCFRICLTIIHRFMSGRPQQWPLTVVLEGGHKNCGDAVRVHKDARDEIISKQQQTILGPMIVETKRCGPLAAADALVHNLFRSRSTGIAVRASRRHRESR